MHMDTSQNMFYQSVDIHHELHDKNPTTHKFFSLFLRICILRKHKLEYMYNEYITLKRPHLV